MYLALVIIMLIVVVTDLHVVLQPVLTSVGGGVAPAGQRPRPVRGEQAGVVHDGDGGDAGRVTQGDGAGHPRHHDIRHHGDEDGEQRAFGDGSLSVLRSGGGDDAEWRRG